MAVLYWKYCKVRGLTCSTVGWGGYLRTALAQFFSQSLQSSASIICRSCRASLRRLPLDGRLRSPGKTRHPSACSETQRGKFKMNSVFQMAQVGTIHSAYSSPNMHGVVFTTWDRSVSHRQIVDSLRKRSYLFDSPLRVLHLPKKKNSQTSKKTQHQFKML